MTQPTGNPVGRPKTKEYSTLLARVPQDLVDRVKHYARIHRLAVADLIRDGLTWRITDGDPHSTFMYDNNGSTYSSNTSTPVSLPETDLTPDMLDAEEVEARPQEPNTARPVSARQRTKRTTLARTDVADVEAMPLAPVDMSRQPAEPQPGAHALGKPGEETRQRPHDAPAFDASKYRLGTLCPRGHDEHGTGQSLRSRTHGRCLACDREKAREQRQAKQLPAVAELEQRKAALLAQLHRWQQDEGLGPQALAERLNATQVPTLSGRGHWSRGTVAKLLR